MKGALSDLRAAPIVWGAVCLTMFVSQTIMCSIIAARTAIDLGYRGPDEGMGSSITGPAMIFSVIVSVFVMLWVITSALNQRRHQLALLVLQGALPWQLLLRNLLIVMALFVLAIVASSILVPVVTPLLFGLLVKPFNLQVTYTNAHILASLRIGFIISGITILIGTVLTVHSLSRIRPIEALRQSQDPPKTISVFRVLAGTVFFIGALCMLLIPGFATQRLEVSHHADFNAIEGKWTGFIGFSMGGMFLLVFALAFVAPYLLHWFTRLWTHVVAVPSSTWKLARQQAVGRIQRQGATIIPMTAGLSLLMTFAGVLSTMIVSLQVAFPEQAGTVPTTSTMFESLLAVIGPALIIAVTGAVAGLLITSRGRRLDLALTYVSGAEVGQLKVLGALDGAITMATSILLAFFITLMSTSSLAFMMKRYVGHSLISVQWSAWLIVFLVALFIGAAATGVQSSATRYENSVAVIAQAIGE